MGEKIIFKDYESDIKAIEDERALTVTITTNVKDRDGDIIEPKGIKLSNYLKNPVVLMAHDYRGLPIARAEKLERDKDSIKAKVVFPEEGTYPLADTVYKMYKNKFMKAWSIGFIPLKSEDLPDENGKDNTDNPLRRQGRLIKSAELLEFSACSVPSNPTALTNMMAKGIDLNPLKDAGLIEIEEDEEENQEEDQEDQKAKYNCECIDCGHKMTSEKHCRDIKCPKCGGTMRRVERPGPGQDSINEGDEVSTKPEETETMIRIPVRKCEITATIDISKDEGIKALYCGKIKKVATYIFLKAKGWTMEKAKKWVEEHEKEKSTETSNECNDDKEERKSYNANEIYEIVLENRELKEELINLKESIEELELKVGAVLNRKNKQNLKDAQGLIQVVLDSAEPAEESSMENDEDLEKDGDVIEVEDDPEDDELKDEAGDEDNIEVDDELISEVVNERMDYLLGKVKRKSDTKENNEKGSEKI